MSNRKVWLCVTGIAFALVNLAVFYWIAGRIGGDAYHGYAENGHYFLATSHGPATEVSRSVFSYSKWHATTGLVTHPIGLICAVILYFWCKRIVKSKSVTT
jgi:hypothetical protein